MTKWLRSKDEIMEYPYTGRIIRVNEGTGMDDDTTTVLYEGIMDEHMVTKEEGNLMQTASYVISIPLTKNDDGMYIIPAKGDYVIVNVYGVNMTMEVDNAEPSQLGGVSIYASRNEKVVFDEPESDDDDDVDNDDGQGDEPTDDDDNDLMGD